MLSEKDLKDILPLNDDLKDKIVNYRNTIKNIINKDDNRKLIIVGPCSIHNDKEAIDYAIKLLELIELFKNKFFSKI